MISLEFKAVHEEDFQVFGKGETLFQALADIEKELVKLCGENGLWENDPYLSDFEQIMLDLSVVGGYTECWDFSDLEGGFVIKRIS